jgi:hypothetical protein
LELIAKECNPKGAGCWWFTPAILATQKAEISRIYLSGKKIHYKKGLVEWLKV